MAVSAEFPLVQGFLLDLKPVLAGSELAEMARHAFHPLRFRMEVMAEDDLADVLGRERNIAAAGT